MIQLQCSGCGCINRNLLLSETKGIFECTYCGSVNRIIGWKENCFPIVKSDVLYHSKCRKTDLTDIFLERRRHIPKGFFTY